MTVQFNASDKPYRSEPELCEVCRKRRLVDPLLSRIDPMIASRIKWWHRDFSYAMWRDQQEAEANARSGK